MSEANRPVHATSPHGGYNITVHLLWFYLTPYAAIRWVGGCSAPAVYPVYDQEPATVGACIRPIAVDDYTRVAYNSTHRHPLGLAPTRLRFKRGRAGTLAAFATLE
jgi:hypothetical protein